MELLENCLNRDWNEGDDVTELLGVVKWDPPPPANMVGQVKGNFPSFIQKTDQERCISGETLISTNMGELSIQYIVDNRLDCEVLSYNHETNTAEYKKIVDWSVMTRRDTWVKITTKSGKQIVCTKNHRIWCDDISAYRQAEEIRPGQLFILKN